MLCLSGFELYPRWVPLKTNEEIAPQSREILQTSFETCKNFPYYSKVRGLNDSNLVGCLECNVNLFS